MSLLFQKLLLRFQSTGEFFVKNATSFEGTPVWGDVCFAFLFLFFSGAGCDGSKNSRGHWTDDGGAVPFGEGSSDVVDCCEFAFGHLSHKLVYFDGGWNQWCLCPSLAHTRRNGLNLGKIFAIMQFLLPCGLLIRHKNHKTVIDA
jgi:hypothetical protein